DPVRVAIDSYEVAQADLGAGNQVSHWRHQILLDRSLQVSRSVFDIRAFFQQEVLYRLCAVENEASLAGRLQDPLLHHAQFDFQDLRQVFSAQPLEYHNLVDAVHELRRELSAGSIRSGPVDALIMYFLDHL